MKVVHLSKSDISGGAARSAYRLHSTLVDAGVDSSMLVEYKQSDDPTVTSICQGFAPTLAARLRTRLDRLPRRLYPRRVFTHWSLNWLPLSGPQIPADADIVHLHWVGQGFLPIGHLPSIRQPIVWTFHDMGAFTGGCHVAQTCERYTQTCGACPQLGSSHSQDLSHWIWRYKQRVWRDVQMTLVTPSRWLADCTRRSSLFRDWPVKVIPNGLDPMLFRPAPRAKARQAFGLDKEKPLILFGALDADKDENKGFQFLQPALRQLAAQGSGAECVIFGAEQPTQPPDVGLPVHYLGRIHDDERLAHLYSAADVMVVPSMQENLPNTVMESLACGTPCVAFRIGGIPDMIVHRTNGYLAQPYASGDLAAGIDWVLADKDRWQMLSTVARTTVETNFTLDLQASRFQVLYQEILAQQGGTDG